MAQLSTPVYYIYSRGSCEFGTGALSQSRVHLQLRPTSVLSSDNVFNNICADTEWHAGGYIVVHVQCHTGSALCICCAQNSNSIAVATDPVHLPSSRTL